MTQPLIIHDLRLPLGHNDADLLSQIAKKSGLPADVAADLGWRIVRKSIDARRKGSIAILYSVEIGAGEPALPGLLSLIAKTPLLPGVNRPIVVGAGPAGLFAALALATAGQRPVILEQGKTVEKRQADVDRFWQTGSLDPDSNVQFGEGGAGTFSDGKLTTGIRDTRCRAILEELVLAGAPAEILFQARPHVGTDYLRLIVRNLREKIICLGGEFRFQCKLTGMQHSKGQLTGLDFVQQLPNGQTQTDELPASRLILAIGHSARPTFAWLASLPIQLEAKPFSLGVRIEHLQSAIDRCQYGSDAGHQQLPPADYKLACHLPSGRSVYTFCMCPGGQVVAAASEAGGVVTNGMSNFARSNCNANSALLVSVSPEDFPEPGPLGGVRWQQQLERFAFAAAGGDFRAPAQRVGSFLGAHQVYNLPDPRTVAEPLQPTYRPGVAWCEISDCLPPVIRNSLAEALPLLNRRLPGFAAPETILTGPETRSSSPLRICRDSGMQSELTGLFPCGEGAGYAGGIMSAAVDGLRCAEASMGKTI